MATTRRLSYYRSREPPARGPFYDYHGLLGVRSNRETLVTLYRGCESVVFVLFRLLLLVVAVPAAIAGQNVVPDPGEEIRVVQRGERGAVHGLFVGATRQEILLRSMQGGGPIRIPRAAITGMSVQRGHRSHARQGALIGIGAGVVAGIILGQTSGGVQNTGQVVGISVGAALPLGLLVGWLIRSPEWDGIDMAALSTQPSGEIRGHRQPR